jgi:nicotinamide-nucleotide amidase
VAANAALAPDFRHDIVLRICFIAFNPALVEAAQVVLATAKARQLSIVTAESCTSGLLASVLSEAPGAAELLEGGFVTYTNATRRWLWACRKSFCGPKGRCARKSRARWRKGRSNAPRPNFPSPLPVSPVRLPMKMETQSASSASRLPGAANSFQRSYGDLGRDRVRERAMQDALVALREAAKL